MTTANKVTILRMLLIPVFVVEVLYYVRAGVEIHRVFAVLTFAVAAVLDGVDGFIARRFNQRSRLGVILDPLADKLLLVSGIVLLSFDHEPYLETIPLWVTGAIIGRDVLIGIGLLIVQFMFGKVGIRPRVMGKITTVLQMAMVLWILLKLQPAWVGVWLPRATALFTAWSGLLYLWDFIRQVGKHPASSAERAE